MSATDSPITPDDLLAKFGELNDQLAGQFEDKKELGVKIGIAGAILLILLVFLLGRRRGKQSRTVVEIRRL